MTAQSVPFCETGLYKNKYTLFLWMSVQQCLVSFENAAHCKEFHLYIFNRLLLDNCMLFIT